MEDDWRELCEGFVSRGEDCERASTGEGIDESASLEGSDEGGEVWLGDCEVDDCIVSRKEWIGSHVGHSDGTEEEDFLKHVCLLLVGAAVSESGSAIIVTPSEVNALTLTVNLTTK